jgi:prevent-host-death family protein
MARVPATEFKAKCLELMDRVAERRETFIITKRGKAVARLVPMERKAEESLFGRLRGMAEEVGDVTNAAAPADAWDTLEEWDELSAPSSSKASGRGRKKRRSGSRTR